MTQDNSQHHESRAQHMKEKGKAAATKMMKSDSLVFTFLRSTISSQCSSWTDMLISFALFAWAGFGPFFATAVGAFVGGVVNCIINYRFTFHAQGVSWKAVVVKFAFVWAGSLFFNSYGTHLLYYLFQKWTFLEELGFRPDGYFAAARLLTSLIVSLAWNFLMQRYFVFRNTKFDNRIVELLERIPFLAPQTKQGNN
ncbi:MAG: GtrA family protein [Muribaculaceae bacterium]|nr:GtrA family protein [Muribaculaceae bacterium]